jgi:chromosome segregation ATPase
LSNGNGHPLDNRVTKLETRVDEHDVILKDLRRTVEKIDDRTDKQEREQVRTQTMLENVQREMSSINLNVAKLTDTLQRSNGKWESFYAKAFYGVIGAIVTFVVSYLFNKH